MTTRKQDDIGGLGVAPPLRQHIQSTDRVMITPAAQNSLQAQMSKDLLAGSIPKMFRNSQGPNGQLQIGEMLFIISGMIDS